MKSPTGSKLPLLMACPASFALPWIDEPPGEPAISGKVTHAFLEACANDGLEDALLAAPEDMRPFLRGIDFERLTLDLQPEAAFALDWRFRKARYLGTGLGRDYGKLAETEIGLTTDLLGIGATMVAVDDYKTGHTRYGRPSKWAQTMGAALAASWAFGKPAARVGLIYVDSRGEVFPSRDDVDEWDLDAFADQLEKAMIDAIEADRITWSGNAPDVRPGPHCVDLYCPAFRSCPAKSALVRHMPEHMLEVQRPGYLAPARLAKTWHQINEMKRVLGLIEQEIRELSYREPIDLGDGYELGPRERKVESLEARVTRDVLAGILGADYADNAVTLEVTKAAVEEQTKIWRDRNPKDDAGKRVTITNQKGTGILDRILSEIRARGGSEYKITNNPTVYKKKELP